MLDQLTDPASLPFSVALALMLLLALIQVLGIGDLLGGDADFDAGIEVDVDADLDLDSGLMSLFGLGQLPFLMWLMLLLALFGLVGLSGQQLIASLTGHPLVAWLAGPLAGLAALPLTGLAARPLARVLPRDETTAVLVETLVGREGEVVIGTATRGSPARVAVRDLHGHPHHVMVEPDNDGQRFIQGERVLLVRREGDLFKGIARGDRYLPRID